MGCALAQAAIDAGHEVVIVSGPVNIEYPRQAEVIAVVSTDEMLDAALGVWNDCQGMIGVAAPCDYRPVEVAEGKIAKNGDSLTIKLVETPDIVSGLAEVKSSRWMVAFALETGDRHLRAMQKLERKQCDLIVLNGPESMFSHTTRVEILDRGGRVLADIDGSKSEVAVGVFAVISRQLIER